MIYSNYPLYNLAIIPRQVDNFCILDSQKQNHERIHRPIF